MLIGYYVGAIAAYEMLEASAFGALLFPPAGITLAALVSSPTRRWAPILVAVVVAECFANIQHGVSFGLALAGFAVANVLGPLVGALVVTRHSRRIDLARVSDLMWFFGGGVFLGPLISGLIGGATLWMTTTNTFIDTAATWWLGDALGAMVVGALVISMFATDMPRFSLPETVLAVAFTGGVAFVIHWWTTQPAGFIAIIPLMFLSARNGTRAAAIGATLITAVVVAAWVGGHGDISGFSTDGGVMLTKLQLLTMAAAALLVAAEAAELEAASRLAGVQHETVQLLRRALAPDTEMHGRFADAEGVSRSADQRLEVGGDWYDIIETDDDRVGIVIGDVVGHGEEALIQMGQLRFAAQAFVMMSRDSGQVLEWLAYYADTCTGGTYATCLVAYYDPATGELNYASAGHPPGLVGSGDGTWRWLSDARSTPIGVPSNKQRLSETIEIDGDASLVVYTDGVVERAGEIIDTGLARMFDAVSGPEHNSVTQLVDRLVTAGSDDASFVRVELRRGKPVVAVPSDGGPTFPPPR